MRFSEYLGVLKEELNYTEHVALSDFSIKIEKDHLINKIVGDHYQPVKDTPHVLIRPNKTSGGQMNVFSTFLYYLASFDEDKSFDGYSTEEQQHLYKMIGFSKISKVTTLKGSNMKDELNQSYYATLKFNGARIYFEHIHEDRMIKNISAILQMVIDKYMKKVSQNVAAEKEELEIKEAKVKEKLAKMETKYGQKVISKISITLEKGDYNRIWYTVWKGKKKYRETSLERDLWAYVKDIADEIQYRGR